MEAEQHEPLPTGLLIGGEWHTGPDHYTVENPATEEILAEVVAGTPAALMGDKGTIAGCPFTTPEPKPQPCVVAEFTKAASKVLSGGTPVLLVNPSDLCKSGQIPNGPVVWTTPQTKVLAK